MEFAAALTTRFREQLTCQKSTPKPSCELHAMVPAYRRLFPCDPDNRALYPRRPVL